MTGLVNPSSNQGPTLTRLVMGSPLIERGEVCPATGKPHFEFDPGTCDGCGRDFRCEDCGQADHPFISCKTSEDIRERSSSMGTPR